MQEPSEATATQTPLAPSAAEVEGEAQPVEAPAPLAEPTPEAPEVSGPALTEEEAPKSQFVIHGEEVADEYAVLDHEKIRPHLERQLTRERETLQQQAAAWQKDAQEALESVQENRQYVSYMGNIINKMREEDLPGAEQIAEKFISSLQKKERYEALKKEEGSVEVSKAVINTLDLGLGRREQDAFSDWKARHRDASWKDVIDQYVELRAVSTKKPLQDENTALKAENEGLKERIRTGKGPDLIPKGGSVGNDNELLLDPNTPIEVITEIQARQTGG